MGARFGLELAAIGLAVLVAWALVDWPIMLTVLFGISLVSHGMVLHPQLRSPAHGSTLDDLIAADRRPELTGWSLVW